MLFYNNRKEENIMTIKFKRVEAGTYQWQGNIKINEQGGQVIRSIVVTVEKNSFSYAGACNAWGVTEEITDIDGSVEGHTHWDWYTFAEAKEWATRRYTEWATDGRMAI